MQKAKLVVSAYTSSAEGIEVGRFLKFINSQPTWIHEIQVQREILSQKLRRGAGGKTFHADVWPLHHVHLHGHVHMSHTYMHIHIHYTYMCVYVYTHT